MSKLYKEMLKLKEAAEVPLYLAGLRSRKVLGIIAALILIIILVIVALRDTSQDSHVQAKKAPSTLKQLSQKTSVAGPQGKKDATREGPISSAQKTSLSTSQESKPRTSVPPDPEAKIRQLLNDWKTAWQMSARLKGGFEKYLSFYSENFHADIVDKKGWGEKKTIHNQNREWIEIVISNITVDLSNEGNRAEVRFSQRYNSPKYSDISQKMLIWVKEKSGWRIVSERSE